MIYYFLLVLLRTTSTLSKKNYPLEQLVVEEEVVSSWRRFRVRMHHAVPQHVGLDPEPAHQRWLALGRCRAKTINIKRIQRDALGRRSMSSR